MGLDWLNIRLPPIEAIEHGVAATDYFATEYIGPRTFDRIDYPAAQVYPLETSRSGSNEFTHRIETNLVFERTRGYSYLEDVLHPMADVISECMTALAGEDTVVAYYPSTIEDFAGRTRQYGRRHRSRRVYCHDAAGLRGHGPGVTERPPGLLTRRV
jgi:hypothetical protein